MYSNFKTGDVVELKRPEGILKGRKGIIVGSWNPKGTPKDPQPLIDWVHDEWPESKQWDDVSKKLMTRCPHFTKHLNLIKRR